jgi:hypothetical protein
MSANVDLTEHAITESLNGMQLGEHCVVQTMLNELRQEDPSHWRENVQLFAQMTRNYAGFPHLEIENAAAAPEAPVAFCPARPMAPHAMEVPQAQLAPPPQQQDSMPRQPFVAPAGYGYAQQGPIPTRPYDTTPGYYGEQSGSSALSVGTALLTGAAGVAAVVGLELAGRNGRYGHHGRYGYGPSVSISIGAQDDGYGGDSSYYAAPPVYNGYPPPPPNYYRHPRSDNHKPWQQTY